MGSRQRKRVSKKKNNKYMFNRSVAIISAITAVVTIAMWSQILGMSAVAQEHDLVIQELDKRMNEELMRTEEIEEYKLYTETDEYVEKIAREKLGMVYPEEIIFVAID